MEPEAAGIPRVAIKEKREKMAKRIWTIGAVLMLAVSTYLYVNLAQGTEVVTEIDQLLAKGKEEQEPCRNFRAKLEKFEKAGLSSDSPSHANKEEALEVLDLLETYPGTPPSHFRAGRLFAENHELLSNRVDQLALRLKEAELTRECEIVGMFKHSSLLLKDAQVFHFEKEENDRVRGLVTAYLKSEMPSYNLLAIAVRGSLLEKFLAYGNAPGKEKLIARARGFMHLFEDKRRMVAQEASKSSRWSMYLLSFNAPEIAAAHELDREFGVLLKEARI